MGTFFETQCIYSTYTPGHRVQPCFHTYAHATRLHTRTHSKLKIPITPRTTQFSHQGNLHARLAIYPRSNRPRTGKRSSEGQNVLGHLVKCYHLVLGLNAIQVHTHTHTENHYANEGSALVEKCSVIPQYVSKWRPLYRPETSTGSSEGNCSRFDVNTR